MVPQAIRAIAALPTNASGKVDRRALPAIDWPAELAAATVAPAAVVPLNAAERKVAAVWGAVLGVDPEALSPTATSSRSAATRCWPCAC